MEAIKLVDAGSKNKQPDQNRKQHTERLIVNAIKSPQTINFEEILLLDAVQQLSKQAKQLFQIVDLYLKKDIVQFKSQISKMKKVLDEKKISMEEAVLKKQYIQICSIGEDAGQESEQTFTEIAKLLDIDEDDIEEWIIQAMSHGIIDAKMDQLNDKVVIKTTMVRNVDNEEWLKIREKIKVWK